MAVAWLCLWAIRPTATILGVFILVPGHQISSRCTVCGTGASAPHRLHLWPREESWTGGGRGGPGVTRGQWAVQLLQCTASLPWGSRQCNSCNALPHCLGAVGSATPAMYCLTTWGQWTVQLLRCTASLA